MRGIVVVLVLFAAGCSGSSSPAPAAKALTDKEIEAVVAKRVAEELKKREAADNRQKEAEIAAAAKKQPGETKPKEWTLAEAMAEASKIVEATQEENLEAALGRLSGEERLSIRAGLTRKDYEAMHDLGKPKVIGALRDAGLNRTADKRLAETALKDKGFEDAARAVWDKVPGFRNPAAVVSAAKVFALNDFTKMPFVPFQYFPPKPESGVIDSRSRDFWEAFSGTTWDKLK